MQQHVVVFTGASSAIAQATVRQYRQTLAASGQAAVCIGLGRAVSARGLDSVYDALAEHTDQAAFGHCIVEDYNPNPDYL